jgi:hypothetical protein
MVEVPSTNDETSFYRAIAKGLGIGAGQSLKGGQVRQKVEDTLQGGDLLLVLDEAHYLWPQQARIRDALPRRLNWIMTALVNHGVSVALITTPQFLKTQRVVEKATHWTSGQFIGRISHYETLPETLTEADLAAVARRLFPEGDESAITGLVCYARTSSKYLAGIEQIVKRARFLARRDGRVQASALDVASALESSVIPSDTALAHALGVAPQCHVTASRRLPARRLQRRDRVTAKCPSGRRVETVAAAELAPV